ncbi:FkbM family methyltransferase [Erysipelotrichia bacterium]|jgi:FkbM family methyltransferase
MKLHKQTIINKAAKILARPLSILVGNPFTEKVARAFEAYWCALLGKGAGTGWAMDAEISAARWAIRNQQPVLFDVGANCGEWSTRMQKEFGLAQIFMFEPQPACQEIICGKNLPRSILIPFAASDFAGKSLQLFTSCEDSGIASIHQRRDSYFSEHQFTSIEVSTVTIDQIIEQHGLSQVDFVKIDVEGHELAVLHGAEKSLKKGVIKALSFEFGSGNLNSRTFFHDFWDLLTPLNYRIFRILPASQLLPIDEYYEDCEYFRGVTNYIAVLDAGFVTPEFCFPRPGAKLKKQL